MREMQLDIRETLDSDLQEVLAIHKLAFGQTDEVEHIQKLVQDLLSDESAKPYLSLLALEDDIPVGHVLFTNVRIENSTKPVPSSILAPFAVIPEAQRKGVGRRLIKEGARILSERGVCLVFVLGDPDIYNRYGFEPAWRHRLIAPYPQPKQWKDAWMVMELKPDTLSMVQGNVVCATTLDKPEYWQE